MSLLMYKFRIYPNRKQKQRLVNSFKVCKGIYNEILSISIDSWKFGQVSLNKFDHNKYLTGKFKEIHSQSKQNIADRVNKAFQNFFRRAKNKSCRKKGFPRFKSRVMSITYPQSGFKFLSKSHLQVSKIGNIPIVLHRVPKGKVKTLTIKQNRVEQWFAIFCCEIDTPIVEYLRQDKRVGIDLGIESFATLSNGEVISNPRYLVKSEKRLKFLGRWLSRKVKGSVNRSKARFRLAKQHIKVANQRSDFLHKQSKSLALKYGVIAVEDLKVVNMVKNHCLAKHIGDASWNSFIQMLSYKAIASGGQLIKVEPRGTSKTCNKCGTITEMPLNKREFLCPQCGFVSHRDLNASINILKVATDCGELNACEHNVRPSLKAVVDEAGTITAKPSTSSAVGSSTF